MKMKSLSMCCFSMCAATLALSSVAFAADPAPSWARCPAAKFSAHDDNGTPTLFAHGEVTTTGYQEKLQMSTELIEPPRYELVCLKPSGMAGQMMTPYDVSLALPKSTKQGAKIPVYDAAGLHLVEYKSSDK
jgi:hypothetical protein